MYKYKYKYIYIYKLFVLSRSQKRKHVISILLVSKLRVRDVKLAQDHMAC